MDRFYQDRHKDIYEEVQPGRVRAVTAADGSKYVQEQTLGREYLENLRGPLIEVPDPWMSNDLKVHRVDAVLARWENPYRRVNGSDVSHLIRDLKVALGHQIEQENP